MAQLAQLKSSAITFNSDDPTSSWDKTEKAIEAWVRSLKGGRDICDFFDCFYTRSVAARNSTLVPSFLKGGAWCTEETLEEEVSADEELSPLKRRGAASGLVGPHRASDPLYRISAYSQLSYDSQQLDLSLLPYLQAIVHGSKAVLLDHLDQPLFTQGMVMLHKHFERDCCSKVTSAFTLGRELRYGDDTKEYQIQLYSFVQTLLESKATIYDFILASIMDSGAGLPSAVK